MKRATNNMFRLLSLFIMFCLPFVLQGQTKPLWLDSEVRSIQFPSDIFYTGFAEIEVSDGNFTKATERAKQVALGELSERVIVSVNTEKDSQTTSEDDGQSEKIRSKFVASIYTNSKTEIAGSTLETYTDKQAKIVFGFVRVKKVDLYNYYKSRINRSLIKVENDFITLENLISVGKKMSARRMVETTQYTLKEVSYFQDIVTSINEDETALQNVRGNSLLQKVNKQLVDLEQSTLVYLNCLWQGNTDENPNLICDIISQGLSENGCAITTNSDEADYRITLTASTTQRSNGSERNGVISYYANLQGALFNNLTKKKVVDLIIVNDADCYAVGRNAQDAVKKAFLLPELKTKFLEKILLKLNE